MLMSVYPYNRMVTTACMSLVLALDYYYPSDRKDRNINVKSRTTACPPVGFMPIIFIPSL